MCVIAAKPAGVKMPTREQMEVMWFNNPDGAGIMYAKDGKVHIDKGYMKPSAFLAHVEALQRKVNLDEIPVVLHFRIASAGGIKPENCHPFPLTSSEQMIRRLHCVSDVGIAHNGTIHGYGNSLLSDTMQYIMLQIYPLSCAVPYFYRNRAALETIVNSTKGSWMVLLSCEGDLITIGDFFPEQDGIFYSNKTFHHRPCFCDIYTNGKHIKADRLPEEEADFHYLTKKPLVWLGEEKAIQIEKTWGGRADMNSGDWLIDRTGQVYRWYPEWDAAIAMEGYRLKTERQKAVFDIDKAVFTEIYSRG